MPGLAFADEVAPVRRVQVYIDLPQGVAGISTFPITFGIPFPEGEVKTDTLFALKSKAGERVAASFEITSLWIADRFSIRWLLVRAAVPEALAKSSVIELVIGEGASASPRWNQINQIKEGNENDAARQRAAQLALFCIEDGDGRVFNAMHPRAKVVVETETATTRVTRIDGAYAGTAGELGRHTTRLYETSGSPVIRLVHTMTWDRAGDVLLSAVRFRLPGDRAANDTSLVGVDSMTVPLPLDSEWRQTNVDRVESRTGKQGRRFDGWVEAGTGSQRAVAALRWPWQQYPTGAIRDSQGETSLNLYRPASPTTLAASSEAAKPELATFSNGLWDVAAGVGPGRTGLDGAGLSKTWEIFLLRPGTAPELESSMLGALAQHPPIACVDPEFATRASLPFPSPRLQVESLLSKRRSRRSSNASPEVMKRLAVTEPGTSGTCRTTGAGNTPARLPTATG